MSQTKSVVIVGAGLAGLSAGYRLQNAGWRVKLLEAGAGAGGRVTSRAEGGFLLDTGPTLISDRCIEYLKLARELGLAVVDSSKLIGIIRGDDLHLVDRSRPLAAFAATGLLSGHEKLRLIGGAARLLGPLRGLNPYAPLSHAGYDTESMERYLIRVFGRPLYDSLLAALARGVTLSTPQNASVLEFLAGLIVAAGNMKSLAGGMQALPTALARRLDITCNAPVTAVRRGPAGVVVSLEASEITCDACLITARFRDAARIYPVLQQTGARLLAATEYTGCYVVQLAYTRRTRKEPFIIIVPASAAAEVSTVFLEHVKAPDRAPSGMGLFSVFFNLNSAGWSDARLGATARDFVERIFPELTGGFLHAYVTRWDYAAHLGNVGYYQAARDFMRRHPADDPVQVAGDYLGISGQESAILAGQKAADQLRRLA